MQSVSLQVRATVASLEGPNVRPDHVGSESFAAVAIAQMSILDLPLPIDHHGDWNTTVHRVVAAAVAVSPCFQTYAQKRTAVTRGTCLLPEWNRGEHSMVRYPLPRLRSMTQPVERSTMQREELHIKLNITRKTECELVERVCVWWRTSSVIHLIVPFKLLLLFADVAAKGSFAGCRCRFEALVWWDANGCCCSCCTDPSDSFRPSRVVTRSSSPNGKTELSL
jgi:hypothetical protein